MGEDRITVKQLIEWLGKFELGAEICVVTPDTPDGSSLIVNEITERRLNAENMLVILDHE